MLSCECWEIFKTSFPTEHLSVAVQGVWGRSGDLII